MASQCLYSIPPAYVRPKSIFQKIFLLTQFAFWKFSALIRPTSWTRGRWFCFSKAEDSEGTVITVQFPLPWSNVQLALPKKKTLCYSSKHISVEFEKHHCK